MALFGGLDFGPSTFHSPDEINPTVTVTVSLTEMGVPTPAEAALHFERQAIGDPDPRLW
jgi:hypothetical protein